MNTVKSALTLLVVAVAALSTVPAVAGERQHQPRAERHNFKHEGARHTRNDRVIKSETQQQVTDNGFKRQTVLTNDQGQTATKNVEVINDKEAGTHTRTMTGTTFNGKPVSGQSVTTKTDDGFTRQDNFTGPNGQTRTRAVDLSADKEAGTVTKTVTTTNPQGETQTHGSTHQIQGNK
ncbi:MAG: hypothetical protein Q7T36_15335 [Fluviicoccus sp.]|uniref:hypothetical protein n=1 Tax=Fluviicoccus sp. TaxID=2003552 RepID=UPI002726CF63|nr:hypothetical protein [Fluviicoccus sp.]MDO8331838.1 hypothetical protein [Fluviicoccus sp.]